MDFIVIFIVEMSVGLKKVGFFFKSCLVFEVVDISGSLLIMNVFDEFLKFF